MATPLTGTPTTPQPQRKSRLGLWIGLALVALILLGGAGVGAFVYMTRFTSTPQETLDRYCSALQSGDYHTAYNQLSSGLQRQFTKSQFVTAASEKYSHVSSCAHGSPIASGSTAATTLTLSYVAVSKEDAAVSLVQENNTWKISQGVKLSTPTRTLTIFCNALKSGDYQTIYNQLSSRSQSQVSEQVFAKAAQAALAADRGLKGCTVSNVREKGSSATGMVALTFGNNKSETDTVPMVEERDVWKLDIKQ
jgi:limonene-1,2-epoxide hydrolase